MAESALLMAPEMIQAAVRLGSARDIYYYGRETLHKQAIPTVVDNRFKQAINNLRQGSNTFIISTDQGVGDIIMAVKLPEHDPSGGVDYTDLALEKGWAYFAVDTTSIRYAGSSQYFWKGSQNFVECMREMPNADCRDRLVELGGAAMKGDDTSGAGTFAGDNMYGYVYLNYPHSSPNGGLAKPNPFPSELLGQAIIVTVSLVDLKSLFSSAAANGSLAGAPSQFEKGWFQVKQTHANDRGDLMVAAADRSKAYSFPTKCFYQNQIDINLSGQSQYQCLLTGFRAGMVRDIFFWITDNADTSPITSAPFARSHTKFVLPKDVILTYNGTVYADYEANSSEIWNLVSTENPSVFPAANYKLSTGNLVPDLSTSKWTEIPFGQVYTQLSASHMYVAGKVIQNAVVGLQVGGLNPAKSYTLSAVYAYNCVLLVSDSSVTYAF